MARPTKRLVLLAAAGLTAVIVLVTALYAVFSGPDEYHITAQFPETPGLYSDNAVDILGVPTGHIDSVTPHAGYVAVVISLPTSVKIPASAKAVLVAPNPVSDRFVELTPPYTGGPTLQHGATIPLSRVVVPLELDQIFSSIDNLSKSLGPAGANKDGELSAALHAMAQLASGNGAAVHQAINTISAALPALTQHPEELKQLITGMDSLTRTLATHDQTINSLYGDLATVTQQFAAERSTIASAVTNLQSGLAEVASFIKTNQANLGSSIKGLTTTVGAVMSEQKALIQTFNTAALGFQNFNNAVEPDGPCLSATGAPHNCPTLWGRIDLPSNAAQIVNEYCGDNVAESMIPILAATAKLGTATATDTGCGAELGLVQGRSGSPGAPKTPDLDLSHYLGSK
jgi:phospholipid/cholesterol/gamma-HCH transport system substrate-binding protein